MPTCEVLPTHTPTLFREAVARAADKLKTGDVVALPTETVYGLAANALAPDSVARIYAIKGRPSHNPIIVHVSDIEMARQCVSAWPDSATHLARAFWPGPLTMVLPKSDAIPDIVTAGGSTVGIRLPGHPFIREVIKECGFPLAAPSANRSNELSPTNVEHVQKQLGDRLTMIVDGGQSQVGIESTVVDLTEETPTILRPGMIHEESLLATVGIVGAKSASDSEHLKSPGQLPRHYAPNGKVVVLDWETNEDLLTQIDLSVDRSLSTVLCHTHVPAPDGWQSINVIPHDAEAYARALYAELHRCDEQGTRWIIVEQVPSTSEWQGVADRLKRASTPAT